MSFQSLRTHHRWLLVSLIVAILARLAFILILDPNPNLSGGDVGFYLTYGPQLIRNIAPPLSPAPVYLLYVGILEILFPADMATTVRLICLLNIVWQGILIVAVYALGERYFNRQIAGLAAFVIAVNPIFIVEANQPLTESVYLGLLFAALAIYAACQSAPTARTMLLLGLLFGLASLTRAVLLLFPLILVVHLIRLHGWRRGLRSGALLILAYLLTVSTWTLYNALRWDRFVVGAEGIVAFTWMGINGQESPTSVDQQAGNPQTSAERNQALLDQILTTIAQKLPDYAKARLKNIISAYLQPHNTVYFPGESLKQIAGDWLRSDRSLGGLLALTRADAFWPKLALFIFHFWALLLGIVGMLLCWRKFWPALPLFGYVIYTTAVHSVLLALPRYLFPVQPVLILFASAVTLALIERLAAGRRKPVAHEI